MSVDDRLRAGLGANAVDFMPEGEDRLAQVHSRLRRRRALQGSAAVASVAAVVAIIAVLGSSRPSRDQEPVPPPTPIETTTTSAAYDGPRIPDSSWTKTLTRADAEEAGIPNGNPLLRDFGDDDLLPLTFRFDSEAYSVLVTNDQGFTEVGDYGTLVYDGPGRLTATSDSPGCPGCEYGMAWEIRGNRLVLAAAPGADIPRVDGFVLLDTWRRSE